MGSVPVLDAEQRAVVAGVMRAAGKAAIELSERAIEDGHRRVFVVVVLEQQPDGLEAVGTGVGHPDDMILAEDAVAIILKVALSTLGKFPEAPPSASGNTFS